MHIFLVLIAVLLVTGAVVSKKDSQSNQEIPSSETVLGEEQVQETLTPTPSEIPKSPTPTLTVGPSATSTPTTPAPSNSQAVMYPGAAIAMESSTTIRLTSTDSPETVTDWYKNKIKELGMNTRSFVQTNTNDNIKNVLAAAKSGQDIHVTITKNAGESQTTILLTR